VGTSWSGHPQTPTEVRTTSSFEPLPESTRAADELDPLDEDDEVLATLLALAERARQVVPDLVGVSLGRLKAHLTFTVVASRADIAVLDGVQYLAGGPCVDGALAGGEAHLDDDDPLSEDRWQLFSLTTAARAVRSTLTLPLLGRDSRTVVGTVNLYAGSRRAFDGQHEALADIFGAWAAGAVTNADLSFLTRREARATPQRVRDQSTIEVAVGILAAQERVSTDDARRRLLDAATRAGAPPLLLARALIDGHHDAHDIDEGPGGAGS